jgi:NTE family protein
MIPQVKTPICLLAIVLLTCAASATESALVIGGMNGAPVTDATPTTSVGLALSGGGARGLAVIGVLRAFEENHIRVSAIAGTSMGGVLGGLYACGYSPDDLERFVDSLDFSTLFSRRPKRSSMLQSRRQEIDRHLMTIRFDGLRPYIPQALTDAHHLTALLTRLTNKPNYLAGGDFGNLPIPFKTTATDVISGDLVILSGGSLAEAMRATMAYPLAFTGVQQGNKLLMDGGMIMPIPVEIVRNMVGPRTPVIAVNTASPLLPDDELVTPVDIAGQVTTIMTADKLQHQISLADLTVSPVDQEFSAADFKYRDEIIAAGYREGLKAVEAIRALHVRQQREYPEINLPFPVTEFRLQCDLPALPPAVLLTRLTSANSATELLARLRQVAARTDVWEVRVSSESTNDSLTAGRTVMHVVVVPAPALTDLRWQIDGNALFDDSTLVAACTDLPSVLSADDLRRAAAHMLTLYHAEGYDLANVRDIHYDDRDRTVRITIDEAVVIRMDVEDNHRSKDWLVRSYFPLGVRQLYSTRRADRGLAELYGTGLFDGVNVSLQPLDTGALMTVGVREKKYTQARIGWHWHEDYRSEGFLELLDDNVGGIGLEVLGHARYGIEQQDYHAHLKLDRIFLTYLTARLTVYYHNLERNLFSSNGAKRGEREETRWGATFYLGQHIARLGTVTAGIALEEQELTDFSRRTFARFGLRSLYFRSLVETLDRLPFPTRGGRTELELRFAGKLIGGEVEFTRFQGSLEAYYTLADRVTFHPSVSLGLSRRGLPSSEKFYLGGMHSLSGFRTSELAGDKFVLINHELRCRLPLGLQAFGRYDIGNVFTSTESIRIADLRDGFGAALATDSPLGTIELGYGAGDSPRDRWYFSVGLRF